MADEITPAFTPGEWNAVHVARLDWSAYKMAAHQVAALALDSQPLGFTWEMVRTLREVADAVSWETGMTPLPRPNLPDPRVIELTRIADRIAALLSPREAES